MGPLQRAPSLACALLPAPCAAPSALHRSPARRRRRHACRDVRRCWVDFCQQWQYGFQVCVNERARERRRSVSGLSLQGGRNSLMEASRHGHLEVVRLLIEKGAEVNSAEQVQHSLTSSNGSLRIPPCAKLYSCFCIEREREDLGPEGRGEKRWDGHTFFIRFLSLSLIHSLSLSFSLSLSWSQSSKGESLSRVHGEGCVFCVECTRRAPPWFGGHPLGPLRRAPSLACAS